MSKKSRRHKGWGWQWGWGMVSDAPDYYAGPSNLSGALAWYHLDEDAGSVTEQEDALGTNANPLTICGSMDSDDLVVGTYGNGQDFDGSDDYLCQKSYEDETGGSWGPTVHGISLADSQAFFNCSGVDLSGFAGTEGSDTSYMLVLKDSSGNIAWGYVGNQEAAEALGSELVANGGFETYVGTQDDGNTDSFTGWTLENTDASNKIEATATAHGGSNAIKVTRADKAVRARQGSIATTAGKLYRLSFQHRGDGSATTSYGIYDEGNGAYLHSYASTGVSGIDYEEGTHYFAAPSGCTSVRLYFGTVDVGTVYFDDVSLKEVTDVGATGVHIVSTNDGSTRNWAGIDASFDYNDSAYTFDVYGTDFQITGDLSVFAWVKPDDGQPSTRRTITSKFHRSNGNRGWMLDLNTDGTFAAWISDASSNEIIRPSSTALGNGAQTTPTHVGFVYDASEATLDIYVNGVADNGTLSGTVTGAMDDVPYVVGVGCRAAGGTPTNLWDGMADEVIIANTALSATDVANLYAQAPRLADIVIVGSSAGDNTLAYSYDGISYTALGKTTFTTSCTALATNGKFWLAGGIGGNTLAQSYDGIHWSGVTCAALNTIIYGLAWNGSMWLALGIGTSNTMAYSTDGLTWTGLGKTIFSTSGYGAAWNGTMWVAGGLGTNSLAYSYNGTAWTGCGTDTMPDGGRGFAWCNGRWAVAGGGTTDSLAYSTDGVTWTGLGMDTFTSIGYDVAANGSMFVAGGTGTNSLAYSYDGISWTGLGLTTFTTGCYALRWNGTRWIAGGDHTNFLAHSTDGITWTGLGDVDGIYTQQPHAVACRPAPNMEPPIP